MKPEKGFGPKIKDLQRFEREILSRCYDILGTRHDAQDAAQDCWLQAWQYRKGRTGDDSPKAFRAWLHTVAHNAALQYRRRQHRKIHLAMDLYAEPPEVAAPLPDPGMVIAAKKRWDAIQAAWGKLTKDEQITLSFAALETPLPEVARERKISCAAAKSKLHRARLTLKKLVGENR
jgi:RNA polymerase sigma-70 factor (ECF subfamily)